MIDAAWKIVTCAQCGRNYTCTPADDYYHRPEIPVEERTLTNGVCEVCLVGGLKVIDPGLN